MSENKKSKSREAELDAFWDIDSLLPAKPDRAPVRASRPTPEAVEIEVARPASAEPPSGVTVAVKDAPLTHADAPVLHFVPPHTPDEEKNAPRPCDEYVPEGVLLHRVRIFEWRSDYRYFDRFARDALRFDAIRGVPCEREPFFSYFPQYDQMGRRQTAWYLWWREQARGGKYVETDYAYVLLYLFECINLPVTSPDEAASRRDAMARVWVVYRRAYPQLDHYMAEWLCDYCLIHRMTAPNDILAPAMNDILSSCRLKEFYLSAVVGAGDGADGAADMATAHILLRHCCQYDYRKSKFASGEHKALFDRVIPAAIAATYPQLTGGHGQRPVVELGDCTVTRDAYTGALCALGNKRRIEVSYASFSRSHELRFLIADMVKHTENRLRAWIGVRSRLTVTPLPTPLRDALDAFLDSVAPEKPICTPTRKPAPRPAYEQLYDLPQKEISLADAEAIERASWTTTKILTEAFGGEEMEEVTATVQVPIEQPVEAVPVAPMPAETDENELIVALGELVAFVRAALDGDPVTQRALASGWRKMPDAVADEINAISVEHVIFDTILEEDGDGYAVVEDYRDDVCRILAEEDS